MMTVELARSNVKEGWQLNPKEKVVNAIIQGVNRCNGECPCTNSSEDVRCPCSNYRQKDMCGCGLYVKIP